MLNKRKRRYRKKCRHKYHSSIGVYCPRAHKSKLFFASEEEAEEFMRDNSDSIKRRGGYAPSHSYYCEACGGWHISSKG